MESPIKLTLIAAQSLDGFIARHATKGSDFVSNADREHLAATMKQFDFYLMGAETYRVIRQRLREKLKPGLLRVVLTRTPDAYASDVIPGVLEFSAEKLPALVARLSAGGQKGAVLGGAQIYRQCLAAGLVDECLITIEPYLFGAGTPLIGDKVEAKLRLIETRMLSDHTVLLRYKVEALSL